MPVATATEVGPGGPRVGARVVIRLLTSPEDPFAPGYVPSLDETISGPWETVTDAGGDWSSPDLPATSLIVPANSVYAADVIVPGEPISRRSFTLPATPGPHRVEDNLEDPPAEMPTLLSDVVVKLSGDQVVDGAKRWKKGPRVDVQAWIPSAAAEGDDLTLYFRLAMVVAAGGTLVVSARYDDDGDPIPYHLAGEVTVPANTDVEFALGAWIYSEIPAAAATTAVLRITGSNVHIRNPQIDGSALTGDLSGGARYVIGAEGSPGDRLKKIRVLNPHIRNFTQNENAAHIRDTLLVWHGVYFGDCEDAQVRGGTIESISGHATYLVFTTDTVITRVTMRNLGWSGLTLYGGCTNWEFSWCKVTGENANGRFYGASVDDLSQSSPYTTPNRGGRIEHNVFSGIHSYGAAVRLAGKHIECSHNLYDGVLVSNALTPGAHANNVIAIITRSAGPTAFTANTVAGDQTIRNISDPGLLTAGHSVVTGAGINGAAVVQSVNTATATAVISPAPTATANGAALGFSSYQDPPSHIDVHDELIIARGVAQRAISISDRNSFGAGDVPTPMVDIKLRSIRMVSLDAANYIGMALFATGADGGFVDLVFNDNRVQARPATAAAGGTSQLSPGCVSVITNAASTFYGFQCRGNRMRWFDTGAGAATTNVQCAFYFGAYVDADMAGNEVTGFYDAVFGALNSGPHTGLYTTVAIGPTRQAVFLEGGVGVSPEPHGSMLVGEPNGFVAAPAFMDPTQTGPYIAASANSLVVHTRADDRTAMIWRRTNATQAVNITAWQDQLGANFLRVDFDGYLINRKTAAPVDAALLSSEMAWWLKNTAGAAGPQFKVKDSAGSVFNFDFSRGAALPDTSGATLSALETEVNAIKARLRTAGLVSL